MLTETLTFITAWYNLPFSILLFICLILTALQLVGRGGEHDADADADMDADADLDGDIDADADADIDADAHFDAHFDADADADTDLDSDTDADHDTDLDDHGGLSALGILAFLGVGKAPLFVVLIILFGTMGVVGWLLNSLIQGAFVPYPSLAFIPVLLTAFFGGSLISSRLARLIGRALPPVVTTATSMKDLVGRPGVVLSRQLDSKYGMVQVKDRAGLSLNVFAIVQDEDPIPQDSPIVLVAYDEQEKRYTATRSS